MPVSEYFGGSGKKVMKNMKSQYGDKKGKQVFYATANARKRKPGKNSSGARSSPGFGFGKGH